jgi:hypothetical protein
MLYYGTFQEIFLENIATFIKTSSRNLAGAGTYSVPTRVSNLTHSSRHESCRDECVRLCGNDLRYSRKEAYGREREAAEEADAAATGLRSDRVLTMRTRGEVRGPNETVSVPGSFEFRVSDFFILRAQGVSVFPVSSPGQVNYYYYYSL